MKKMLIFFLTIFFFSSLHMKNTTPPINNCKDLNLYANKYRHDHNIKTFSISARIKNQTCSLQTPDINKATRLQIASCTKPITASIILELLEKNPEKFNKEERQLIKKLLNHSAKLPPYTEDLSVFSNQASTPRESRRLIIQQYLENKEVQTKSVYSNLGYIYATNIIEEKLAVEFEKQLKNFIDRISKNSEGETQQPPNSRPKFKKYWKNTNHGKKLDLSPLKLPNSMTPVGNLFISAETLRQFGDTHMYCLNNSAPCRLNLNANEAHTPFDNGYGLGWKIQKINNSTISQHLGKLDSARCAIAISPEENRSIAIITTEGDPNAINFIRSLIYNYF